MRDADMRLGPKRQKTRETILACAEEAFIKNGFVGTDISEIAEKAGVDKRTIYRYFSGKEALAFIIWCNVLEMVLKKGMAASGANGFKKLANSLNLYIENALAHREIIRFLGEFDHTFSGEYPNVAEAKMFVEYVKTHENAFSIYLKEGVKDGSIQSDLDVPLTASTLSNIMLALCQRVVIRDKHLSEEQGYSNEVLPQAVKIILEGIKGSRV